MCDHDQDRLLVRPKSSPTHIGNVATLDDAIAAFKPLCACPSPNVSRLAPPVR